MKLSELKRKNIHLIGLSGAEGSSLALALLQLGCKNLTGHDFSTSLDFKKNYQNYHQDLSSQALRQQLKKIYRGLVKIHYRQTYLKDLKEAALIFAPSSYFRYPLNVPLAKTKNQNKIWNWYNFILEFFPGRIIGVTGTAGKGTTVKLIYDILKSSGKTVWRLGDSWQSAPLAKIIKAPANSYLVAELSNRTLKFAPKTEKSPFIAVVTNVSKNHLDDHQGSFAKYLEAKKQIAKHQKREDWLVLNQDDPSAKWFKNCGPARKTFYSLKQKNRQLIKNKNLLLGKHLMSDALAARATAKILKISDKLITKGLKQFKSREARFQLIRKFKGLTFINDAAATRPEATMMALESLPKNRVNLILEGSRFKPDPKQFLKLIRTANKQGVKNIAVSGKINEFLYPLLSKFSKSKIKKTKNLEESFKNILALSKRKDIVLLSPACESFGEFKDYRERSRLFIKLVRNLK